MHKWGWDQKRKKYGVEAANLMMQHEKELNMRAARKKAEHEMNGESQFDDDFMIQSDGNGELSDDDGTLQKSVKVGPKDVSQFEFIGNKTP